MQLAEMWLAVELGCSEHLNMRERGGKQPMRFLGIQNLCKAKMGGYRDHFHTSAGSPGFYLRDAHRYRCHRQASWSKEKSHQLLLHACTRQEFPLIVAL